jgi:phosphoribosylamine--glycine ligase
MGAFAPLAIDAELMARIERCAIRPTLAGMASEGAPYRGVLYAGLMVSQDGTPYLLEHNVRFGDPETQVLMPLLDGDVAALLASAAAGALDHDAVKVTPETHSVVVVLAAGGYPAKPRKGDPIDGLTEAAKVEGVSIYHAGTREEDGTLVTSGGRVLGVGACGHSASQARQRAYKAITPIRFEGMHFRRDIAASATT